jgi:hypothetical protein
MRCNKRGIVATAVQEFCSLEPRGRLGGLNYRDPRDGPGDGFRDSRDAIASCDTT